MNDNIESFKETVDVPDNFSGKCYITSSQQTRSYKNGKRHCLDGPAVVARLEGNIRKLYFINGKNLSPKMFWKHPEVIQHIINSIVEL